jgi:hypothetical protein
LSIFLPLVSFLRPEIRVVLINEIVLSLIIFVEWSTIIIYDTMKYIFTIYLFSITSAVILQCKVGQTRSLTQGYFEYFLYVEMEVVLQDGFI